MWSKLDTALIYAHDIELIEVKDAIRDATSRRVSATRGNIDIQQSGNKVYFESAVECQGRSKIRPCGGVKVYQYAVLK